MASRGKRSAGERVLESKHVIGLFLLMLVFSGVFFTLGYVMGRNQYDGQVRAATDGIRTAPPDPSLGSKKVPVSKQAVVGAPDAEADPAMSANNSDWEFYGTNKPAKSEPRLDAVPAVSSPKATSVPGSAPAPASSGTAPKNDRTANGPMIPNGAFVIQVAALKRQDDALAIASSLQRKHYLAYVQPPKTDKFYRVQVGPFKDQKTADAAKRGLESEGFKAFYSKH